MMSTIIMISCLVMTTACGSNWTISGNEINVTKVTRDSVAVIKKGTYIITEKNE